MSEAASIDPEETPQSRQRKRLAKESVERKAAAKPAKEWMVVQSGKVVKKVRMANGNIHSAFVCNTHKKNAQMIEDLKKKFEFKSA